MENTANTVEIQGVLTELPTYSHSVRGEAYYTFPLTIARLSGAVDVINVIVREELLRRTQLEAGACICVWGELRSFNNKSGKGNRLVITVFAREIAAGEGEDVNLVTLTGTLCKKPNLRRTPMGREICDMMLAVNRWYGRSDYLPCIAWGRVAQRVADWDVGTRLHLVGRIQSRKYIKTENDVPVEKTAFEVSVIDAEAVEAE